ncbi:outer membrane beta-barrel family protein [Flavobacterium hibernum]|uniref:TonB-dependent receptor n=1 Tax=Flavobacterium hibernum TaxID=37752 RepID=A0A0D0F1W1_9FLAO|nr:outer membrane beta-barrel family protein [Flavobacterium hibernum]KIO52032.1 TonB-dependent receptor [Flavobacterium hibernum]OXA91133.1 TonB-dependent receptor [Flavobacterium hibernum]STO11117.1 Outer membrane cobalamin receptor protein [Flavobacterium hibernum]
MPLKIFLIVLLFLLSLIANAQNETPKDSVSNKLNEVVINQNKKTFTNTNGTIKVDVANSIFSSIPNAVELLAKLPTVQVSVDRETITVVGKGNPLIYIDNQKVGLNDLNTLAVVDIKTIEIIQNPSSKYEAEGRSVILITRKFSKKDSFRAEISEVASFKKNYNNYLGFNSSFKKNKLELKANFNYNRLNPWESHSIDYQIPSAEIASKYDVTADTKRKQYVFGGGLFYKINEDDYFSVNVSGKLQSDTFPINTITDNKNKDVINNVVTYSDNSGRKNFVNSFLNYQKKIKSIDAQVFTGLQYSNFDQTSLSNVQDNFNNTEFELTQNRDQRFKVNVFSGRIDVEKKFKNEMKLEAGGLYSSANSKSDIDIFYYQNNKDEISHYDFSEQNLAGYSQLSGKIKKVDFSVGFRVENTNVDGKFKSDLEPLVDKNYTKFFPKAQFIFPIDSIKSISVNYAKSISRPNYSSLSQGATYINPYFLYARNIFLDPTIIDEISTTFQYHDKSVRFSYSKAKNPVYSSFSFDDQNNIMTFKDINYDKSSAFTVDFTLPFTYKFWTTTNSLIFILERIEDHTAQFRTSKPYSYFSSNNEFKLPKEYALVLNFWGLTKQYTGVFETSSRFVVDLAASKTFLKKWKCTLSWNNVFKNNIQSEQFTINNVTSKARYVVDNHEVSIAIRYSFGKIGTTEFKEKNIDENENRIR